MTDLAAHPNPIRFDNSYARLPARLFAQVDPQPVAAPRILRVNRDVAALLGIDLDRLDADTLAGNAIPAGATPIAQAYAGHQFGHFSPSLGDGRAILLGEVLGIDGQRRDIQLKGSGPTPFSRRGDGRAAIGPVLREYLIGEAMHALGIPTTRALAAVATGQDVQREVLLPGAVLVRVAASHLRVGTFQYFAARNDTDAVRALADYAIARHDPACAGDYPAFLAAVVARQAELVARWMLVGFIHGVMNTDNMAISGETIDYGPCAFMDGYDPATVFSSIDEAGRYAYAAQPGIAAWNLTRLAEALLPLLGANEDAAIASAKQALSGFAPRFQAAWRGGLRAKLGLAGAQDGDDALLDTMLARLQHKRADWTLSFRHLADQAAGDAAIAPDDWTQQWLARLDAQDGGRSAAASAMRAINPLYIPRNHLVDAALVAATAGDLRPFEDLLAVITRPYERRAGLDRYAAPPLDHERVLATFCGT